MAEYVENLKLVPIKAADNNTHKQSEMLRIYLA